MSKKIYRKLLRWRTSYTSSILFETEKQSCQQSWAKNVEINFFNSSLKKQSEIDHSLKTSVYHDHKDCIDEDEDKGVVNYWEKKIQTLRTDDCITTEKNHEMNNISSTSMYGTSQNCKTSWKNSE